MQGGNQGTFRDRIGVNRRNSLFLILAFSSSCSCSATS
jgi:hypothetical protein